VISPGALPVKDTYNLERSLGHQTDTHGSLCVSILIRSDKLPSIFNFNIGVKKPFFLVNSLVPTSS
jgi:hypothetical protein